MSWAAETIFTNLILVRTRPASRQPPAATFSTSNWNNTKKLKISSEWRQLLIDEVFLYLFSEFSEKIDAEINQWSRSRLAAADLNALSPSLTLTRALTGLSPKVILYKKTTQTAQ